MLVSVNMVNDPVLSMIYNLLGENKQEEIKTGVYICGHFNFGNMIADPHEDYSDFGELGSYGVCDYPEQVIGLYADYLSDPDKKYCISFCQVKKSEQESSGGWRWHKWGEYIGKKKPQYEYLYDEGDDIQEVYCYHIYQIL